MIRALLLRSALRARGLLLPLAVVLTLFQVLVVAAAAYVQERQGFSNLVALLPPVVQQVMGGVFSSFGAMVAFGYFHPIVIVAFVAVAIIVASEPAADVEASLVDLVLARPVPRAHLVTRSVLMLALTTAGMAGLMVAGSWSAMRALALPGTTLPLHVLLKLAANLVAVAWVLGGAALAVACMPVRRAAAAGSIGILALALYIISFLADVWPRVRVYGRISPFHYYQPLGIVSGSDTRWRSDVLWLVAVGIVLCGVAYVAFSRRDV